MGLATVLQSALSGLSVARTTIDIAANNLANANTNGFKQSKAVFSTQTPNTLGLGSGPTSSSGGVNPRQVGSGGQTAAVVTDFSQGSLVLTNSPTKLALQGDGFFIVENSAGEQLYSRSGNFSLNGSNQLVDPQGNRALGFGVDNNFKINSTALGPITIPLGSRAASADGTAASLVGFSVGQAGRVKGRFSDGITRDLGQLQVARFANPGGLEQRANNLFAEGVNSGLPVQSDPGTAGSASIVAGGVELSNTDIGQNLIDLTLASSQFKSSLVVFDTADALLDDLLNLAR